MNYRTADAPELLPKLPPIFAAACDGSGLLSRPWVAQGRVYAGDGRIFVRADCVRFRREALDGIAASDDCLHPNVLQYFRRWEREQQGLPVALPPDVSDRVACECVALDQPEAQCPTCQGSGRRTNRSRLRVGPVDLIAYRVAMLVLMGVRTIRPGATPSSPVHFACGIAEGLLMPMRETVATR